MIEEDVNHQRLKHVGLQLGVGMGNVHMSLEPATIGQLTSGSNPYQSCRTMEWPSPFGQRRMLFNLRCHHRIPQATLGLTHASHEGLHRKILAPHIRMPQFIPPLKKWASLRRKVSFLVHVVIYHIAINRSCTQYNSQYISHLTRYFIGSMIAIALLQMLKHWKLDY